MTTPLRATLEPLPDRMKSLRVDERGYPVPWFVVWVDGPDGKVPEFRAMDVDKWVRAVKLRLCWVCGSALGRWLAFVLGPMCAVTRTTSEPPCHRECAEWSARNCPFLSDPRAVRREGNAPPGMGENTAGIPITRNPGVAAVWITRSFEVFNDGTGKPLITVGEAESVSWWREGRVATRAEVEDSISGGMPALLTAARRDGPFAIEQLGEATRRAARWYPAA